MKISEVSIKNFRSFGDTSTIIPMNPLSALIGGNSSGKSNVLKALDLFFNYSKKKVTAELFHNGNLQVPIEISLTFAGLNAVEKKAFKRNLSPDNNLRIKQIITTNSATLINADEDDEGKEGGLSNVNQEWRGMRKIAVSAVIEWLNCSGIPSQTQLDAWWATDLKIGEEDFKSRFPNGKPTPEEFQKVVDKFWEEDFDSIPQIEWLNKSPTKPLIKNWWKQDLITNLNGFDFKATYFPNAKELPNPDQFSDAVSDFWLAHEDKIATMQHEGSGEILGWRNKLKGNLPRTLFVPAIRHLEDEIRVNKTDPFGTLIHWLLGDVSAKRQSELQAVIDKVVASALTKKPRSQQEREEIEKVRDSLGQALSATQLDKETKQEIEETLKNLFSILVGAVSGVAGKSKIELVAEVLNELVKQQFDIMLDLSMGAPQVQKILSSNIDLIGDDGYVSSIREKGEGVQRTIIFTILRAYAKLRDQIETTEHRNTIFLIEEPEICLHPSVRRATYSLLRTLSISEDQVIYTTHDGYFVDVRYFDEIRVLRRIKSNALFSTTVSFMPASHLIEDAKNRYNQVIAETSIREHFGRFYHPAKNEGFFARRIVLVEGQTEEFALPIYFKALGYDLDLEQTAIINAESVQHIDSLFLVFNELGIPCYVVFDGDKPQFDFSDLTKLTPDQQEEVKTKGKRNVHHLNMFGASNLIPKGVTPFFPPTTVDPRVTVFENDFEAAIHSGLPNYDQLKAEAKKLYRDSKPLTARHIAQAIAQDPQNIPPLVSQILDQVKACQHDGTCLMLNKVVV